MPRALHVRRLVGSDPTVPQGLKEGEERGPKQDQPEEDRSSQKQPRQPLSPALPPNLLVGKSPAPFLVSQALIFTGRDGHDHSPRSFYHGPLILSRRRPHSGARPSYAPPPTAYNKNLATRINTIHPMTQTPTARKVPL